MMNCLHVDIVSVSEVPSVSVESRNDLNFSVKIVQKKICQCFKAIFTRISDFFSSVSVVDSGFDVHVDNACERMSFDLGLICMTGLDMEYYLQVLDGDLITLDGCYVKVLKA